MIPVVADPNMPEGFWGLKEPGAVFPSIVGTPSGKIFKTRVEFWLPRIEGATVIIPATASLEEIHARAY